MTDTKAYSVCSMRKQNFAINKKKYFTEFLKHV